MNREDPSYPPRDHTARTLMIMVSWIALSGMAACGGGARPPITSPSETGAAKTAVAIVSTEPCEAPASAESFYAAMKTHAGHDHGHSHGGQAPAAAPPQMTIEQRYSVAEIDSLRTAVDEGRCKKIRYRSEGLTIAGFVLLPPATSKPAHPIPAILVARGGNRDFGLIGTAMLIELEQFASAGFVVVATQYRGADGGDGTDEFGGRDLADLENLVPLARAMPEVDAGNLFLLGYSRGGMMAAMALRNKLPVRAAALFSGLFDLEANLADRPEMEQNYQEMIPDFATRRTAELHRRGAVWWAGELEVPVLILAGTRDDRVPIAANGQRLAQLLAEHDREHKLVTYDDDHQLGEHRPETTTEIVDWFRSHVQ